MTAANETRQTITVALASGVDGGYGDTTDTGLTIRELDALNVALVTEEIEAVYGDDYDVTVTAEHRMTNSVSVPEDDATLRAHVESLIDAAGQRFDEEMTKRVSE